MIQRDLQQLSHTTRDLRKFGLLVGGVFLLLGGWFLWRQKPVWPWLLMPGILLVLLGFIAPRMLRTVRIAWMGLAFTLGLAVSTVLLTIFYFVVVTPLALAGRLGGKDFLSEKLVPRAKSYWLPRDRLAHRTQVDYEQQY